MTENEYLTQQTNNMIKSGLKQVELQNNTSNINQYIKESCEWEYVSNPSKSLYDFGRTITTFDNSGCLINYLYLPLPNINIMVIERVTGDPTIYIYNRDVIYNDRPDFSDKYSQLLIGNINELKPNDVIKTIDIKESQDRFKYMPSTRYSGNNLGSYASNTITYENVQIKTITKNHIEFELTENSIRVEYKKHIIINKFITTRITNKGNDIVIDKPWQVHKDDIVMIKKQNNLTNTTYQ